MQSWVCRAGCLLPPGSGGLLCPHRTRKAPAAHRQWKSGCVKWVSQVLGISVTRIYTLLQIETTGMAPGSRHWLRHWHHSLKITEFVHCKTKISQLLSEVLRTHPLKRICQDAEPHMSLLKSFLFPKSSHHFRPYVHIVSLNWMNPNFFAKLYSHWM